MPTHQTVDLPKGFVVQAPPGKQFHDGEPVIVFRAQDTNYVAVLRFYLKELMEQGAEPNQLNAVREKITAAARWQTDNADLVKIPDYVK